MAWVYLLIAGLLEVVWAASMKQTDGFTRLGPSVATVGTMVASFLLLALAMRSLPLGTAYAVWAGVGVVGTFIFGLVFLDEPASALRVAAALMIVGGLILMKLGAP